MQCHTPCVKPSSAWGWRAPDHRETPRDKSETPARCLSEPVRETQAATNRFSGSTSDRNLGLLHTCCVGSASRPCSRLRSSEFRSVRLALKAQGFPLILIPSTALVLVPPDAASSSTQALQRTFIQQRTVQRWVSLSPDDRQHIEESRWRPRDICCNARRAEEPN